MPLTLRRGAVIGFAAPRSGWGLLRRACRLVAPCREFAPAGDLLFVSTKSRQKTTPAKPPLRGSLRCSKPGAAPNSLRYAPLKQRGAKSVVEACCARAPGFCASRRFRRGGPEQPNSQQPNAATLRSRLFLHSPLEPAEQHKALRARAQHASTTDSAQLSERSVAKRVLRGPSRPEQRREARRAGRIGGRLFAYFLVAQKVGRPPGRTPGTVHRTQRLPAKASKQTA